MENNNLETFSLVWLDISLNETMKNSDLRERLRTSIHCLKIFHDSDECEKYIRTRLNDDRIILIVNDQSSKEIISCIHELRQVSSIYIYFRDEKRNEEWTKQFGKVRCVVDQMDTLVEQIQLDQTRGGYNNINEPLLINILNTNNYQDQSTTQLNGQFVHSQLLIDCLLHMESNSTDRNELIDVCKGYYDGNLFQLNILKEFEHTYSPDQALRWYTRETFLCRLLNKALRVQNIDLLFLFRFFIRDIQKQLEKYQCSLPIHTYRGQLMSNEELQMLKNSVGQFISMNSFFSTSVSREVALFYLTDSTPPDNMKKVLFEIDADFRLVNDRPFANIMSHSYFPNEEEVLIMLGSIFRLIDIRYDESQVYIIRMVLYSNNDNDLKTIIEQIRTDNNEDSGETTSLLSFGNVLTTMGRCNEAEKYYHRLLNELSHDHEYVARCYYGLGNVAFEKGDYDLSLEWYQKSLEIETSACQPDDSHIADSHNSIGATYCFKNNHKQALESFHKAYVIRKRIFGENHTKVAAYFNNTGVMYEKEKKYSEALECHQKALAILQKCLSASHPKLGASHGNIGDVYRNLDQYDLALEHYNLSLEIYKKSYPSQHPAIADTLNGIGAVYEKKGELRKALSYWQEAATIDYHAVLPIHPRTVDIQENIQRVLSQLK